MGYRDERKFKEEEQDTPAMGDELNAPGAMPGAMSHAAIFQESRRFWEGPGHPGFEGPQPPERPLSSTVYAAPASNLPAGPISARELAEESSRKEDGRGVTPTKLPPPAF